MPKKLWQVDGVRNHLLEVREGLRASLPTNFTKDHDGRIAAYFAGCEAAIKCLAEQFGIQDDPYLSRKPQTGELRLKTWTQQEIGTILFGAWKLMRPRTSLLAEQNAQLIVYYQGIDDTLNFVAESFGIEGFVPLSHNGSVH